MSFEYMDEFDYLYINVTMPIDTRFTFSWWETELIITSIDQMGIHLIPTRHFQGPII
jgi:hypothetical protein